MHQLMQGRKSKVLKKNRKMSRKREWSNASDAYTLDEQVINQKSYEESIGENKKGLKSAYTM